MKAYFCRVLTSTLAMLVLLVSCSAVSANTFYSVISAGYTEHEFKSLSVDASSYKLGIAYQIDPKWYLEAGFQSLGKQNKGLEVSGPFIAALGKATGQSGELFYRLGVIRADLKTTSQTAGILGLGFDYYISTSLMIRSEIEHIQGESDYSANAVYIGLRVNF